LQGRDNNGIGRSGSGGSSRKHYATSGKTLQAVIIDAVRAQFIGMGAGLNLDHRHDAQQAALHFDVALDNDCIGEKRRAVRAETQVGAAVFQFRGQQHTDTDARQCGDENSGKPPPSTSSSPGTPVADIEGTHNKVVGRDWRQFQRRHWVTPTAAGRSKGKKKPAGGRANRSFLNEREHCTGWGEVVG
jgi:hypothetical protein